MPTESLAQSRPLVNVGPHCGCCLPPENLWDNSHAGARGGEWPWGGAFPACAFAPRGSFCAHCLTLNLFGLALASPVPLLCLGPTLPEHTVQFCRCILASKTFSAKERCVDLQSDACFSAYCGLGHRSTTGTTFKWRWCSESTRPRSVLSLSNFTVK